MTQILTILTNEALHKKSPQEITTLLYEACYSNLELAIQLINDKEFTKANKHLQKANDIIYRLGGGINYEAGIVADQLDSIYNYMAERLIQANYSKNADLVKEVLRLLSEIMAAWNQAMKKNTDIQPKTIKQKASAYEQTSIYE